MNLYPVWTIPGFSQIWLPLVIVSNLACDVVTSLKVPTNNVAGKGYTQQLQRWHWVHSSSTWMASSDCRGIRTAIHRRGSRKDKDNNANWNSTWLWLVQCKYWGQSSLLPYCVKLTGGGCAPSLSWSRWLFPGKQEAFVRAEHMSPHPSLCCYDGSI